MVQGEAPDSYIRRVLRQGALLGSQWALQQIGPALSVITIRVDEADTQGTAVQPPAHPTEDEARLRTKEQSDAIFSLLREKGFDNTDRTVVLNYVNEVLTREAGRQVQVDSTRHLTVAQASAVITALRALP